MRNLTLTRIAGSDLPESAAVIYLEDAAAPQLMISGIPCRYLGTLLPGQTTLFEIKEDAARLFATAGPAVGNEQYEAYRLPQGSDSLSLNCFYSAVPGQAPGFRFFPASAPAVQKKKKSRLLKIVITIAALVIGSFVGKTVTNLILSGVKSVSSEISISNIEKEKMRAVTVDELTIHLPESYEEDEDTTGTFNAVYTSRNSSVMFFRDDSLRDLSISEPQSLQDYANNICRTQGKGSPKTTENGLVYSEYSGYDEENDRGFGYIAFFYRCPDNVFWVVTFACFSENYDDLKSHFISRAESVELPETESASVVSDAATTKEFSINGITLLLPSHFSEFTREDVDMALASLRSSIFVLVKSEFFDGDEFFADVSVEEYAKLIAASVDSATDVTEMDGLCVFTYEEETNSELFRDLVVTYKGSEAFYRVVFVIATKDYDDMLPDIIEWAKQVTVD